MIFLLFYAFIVGLVHGQFTLANSGKSLTSYYTLTPGVTYELNFTLTKVITSGSTLILSFPTEFRIPSSSLANCMASISTSIAPSASPCTSLYTSGLDQYSVIYANIYTTGGSQTFIWLKVSLNKKISSILPIHGDKHQVELMYISKILIQQFYSKQVFLLISQHQ